jgi:hypothetical protein
MTDPLTALVPTITTPSCFRPGLNAGAADIARGKLLKMGSTYNGVALSTSVSDKPAGVTTEIMEGTTAGAKTRDRQISGMVMVLCGSAVAIGDKITTDSAGRGIPATSSSQSIWGIAQTATSTANEQFSMEMSIGTVSAAAGGICCLEMTVGHADLTAADTNENLTLGVLPAKTWILGYEVVPTALFIVSGQTYTTAVDIGYAGAASAIASDLNLGYEGTVTTPQNAAVSKALPAEKTILVNFAVSTGNVVAYTAGECTIRLYYASPTPVVVDPTP